MPSLSPVAPLDTWPVFERGFGDQSTTVAMVAWEEWTWIVAVVVASATLADLRAASTGRAGWMGVAAGSWRLGCLTRRPFPLVGPFSCCRCSSSDRVDGAQRHGESLSCPSRPMTVDWAKSPAMAMSVVAAAGQLAWYCQICIDWLWRERWDPASDEISSHTFDNCMACRPCEYSSAPWASISDWSRGCRYRTEQ